MARITMYIPSEVGIDTDVGVCFVMVFGRGVRGEDRQCFYLSIYTLVPIGIIIGRVPTRLFTSALPPPKGGNSSAQPVQAGGVRRHGCQFHGGLCGYCGCAGRYCRGSDCPRVGRNGSGKMVYNTHTHHRKGASVHKTFSMETNYARSASYRLVRHSRIDFCPSTSLPT